jgi:hypothetical protein
MCIGPVRAGSEIVVAKGGQLMPALATSREQILKTAADDDAQAGYDEVCRQLDEAVRGATDRGPDASVVYAGLYGVLHTPAEVVNLVLAIEGELLAAAR